MSQEVTLTEQIKTCRTPQEALLLLAEAIDELRAQPAPADPWEQPLEWAEDEVVYSTDEPTRDIEAAQRQAEIEALTAQRAAETDEDERRALAAKIKLLRMGGQPMGQRAPEGKTVQINGSDVVIPDASPGRKLLRRNLARQYRLWEAFTPAKDADEVVDAYAQGGPLWLYHSDNRLCLQLPVGFRQAMLEDIEKDSVKTAIEVGRDLLKAKEGEKMYLQGARPSA